MTDTIIDTNVLLDVVKRNPEWFDWSRSRLVVAADEGRIIVNQIIYAELAPGYLTEQKLEDMLSEYPFSLEQLPWDAAYIAGRAHLVYRKRGGSRTLPLPDFFIGAHAMVRGYRLLTRDRGYYRSYFPDLEIVSPERPG